MSDLNNDSANAPTPAQSVTRPKRLSPRKASSFPRSQVALLGCAALAVVWGAWVSKGVYDFRHATSHIVKVQLSQIVQEYVQATARSNLPPEQIGAQTAAFLKAVNMSVEGHRAGGEVVLLANAVVAGDVPDITEQVRREVFSKVPPPQARTTPLDVPGEMQRYMAAGASTQANAQ